jgi:hypothetical protein
MTERELIAQIAATLWPYAEPEVETVTRETLAVRLARALLAEVDAEGAGRVPAPDNAGQGECPRCRMGTFDGGQRVHLADCPELTR